MCPWIAPGEWLQRLAFWHKGKRSFTLNKKVPKFLQNFWLITLLFLILTWMDFTYELANQPETTVYIALGLVLLAVVVSLIFEKRSFCKYFCPVGGVIAAYSQVAPVELRNKDPQVCRTCQSRGCFKGNDKGYACPMMIHTYGIDRNTHCVLCMECVKTCPNDNISINLRKPFQDIFKKGLGFLRTRDITFDLSAIVVILLGIIPFENTIMTPAYLSLEEKLGDSLGIAPLTLRTIIFVLSALVALGIFWGLSWLTRRIARDTVYGTKRIFVWFALSFIPLAISMHLAHNFFHMFVEGAAVIPALSDPFGFGWNLFGTAGGSFTVLSPDLVPTFQVLAVSLGLVASVYCLYRLAMNMFESRRQALRALSPMAVFLLALGAFYLWLLTIPMAMRF
jgi:ferredoxin